MKTLTVVPQYRSNSFSPVLWDVAHVRKDGLDTIAEVVAENCEKQDATLFAAAPELLAALQWYVDTYAIPESDHKLGIPHLIAGEQTARAAIDAARKQEVSRE